VSEGSHYKMCRSHIMRKELTSRLRLNIGTHRSRLLV
jgi:hypothetical protein